MEIVYVIGSDDAPYKVGMSSDIDARIRALQTGYPSPLRLIVSAETACPAAHEKALHAALSNHRLSGEWFSCDLPTILCEMKGIGLDPILCRNQNEEFWLDGIALSNWLVEMAKPPFFASDAECARLLGISANGLLKMKKQGTDRRTALACRALLHRMEPYA